MIAVPQNFRPSANAPAAVLGAVVGLYMAIWTLVPSLVASAPPLDVAEGYAFGRAGLLVTHEHPNLPGLVLEGLRRVTGATGWPAYLLSAGAMAAAVVLVHRLGRDVLGEPGATAGAALLFGLFYYQWPVPEWNHNVAQVPLWAAVCLTLWRAVHRGGPRWWGMLGFAAGLALWAKYAPVAVLGLAALYVLVEPAGRRQLRQPGPWLAAGIFLSIVAPQVAALASADWAPLAYAAGRAGEADAGTPWSFLLAQIADHAVMLIVAAVAAVLAWRAGDRGRPHVAPRARRFLLLFGLGPVLGTAAGAAILGVGLQDMWGMPMVNLSGLLLVMAVPGLATDASARRIAAAGGVVTAVVAAGYGAHIALAPLYRDAPHRENWPRVRLAAAARDAVVDAAGAPVNAVAGPGWLAGLVLMDTAATYRPTGPAAGAHRLGRGDPADGPLLALGAVGRAPREADLTGYVAIDRGTLRLTWTAWRDRPPVTVPYAVMVPADRKADAASVR